MRSLWWLAVAVTACGDVNRVPDAAIPDAYAPDSPSEQLACGTGEMACNGTCANVMTSELHCGNCATQCAPNHGCSSGACVPANTSCSRVREIDPQAPDGLYRNPNSGVAFFCDFTNGNTYDALGMGAHNAAYTGYTLMSVADFNKPIIQQMFVAIYNEQGGLLNLQSGWSSGNCCFKAADSGAGQYLGLGGHHLYPAKTASATTQCGGQPYTDARYRFFEAEVGPYAPLPMPADYFATHAATQVTSCSEGAPQPGFFMKRRGLN